MAEKLSITIALEGAAEIERQLEGIGQAGTKAFADIGKAAEKSGGFDQLDPKDVQAKLQKFGVTGKEAIDKITKAVASAGRLERIVGGVAQVERGFASIGTAATAMAQKITGAFTSAGTAASASLPAIRSWGRAFGLLGSAGILAGLGAAVVGMEKAADTARILEGNLQALFNSTRAGSTAFSVISNAAQTAGTTLQSAGDTIVGIVRAIRSEMEKKGVRFLPGVGIEEATAAAGKLFDTLQKGMALSGARASDADKSIRELLDNIKKNGAAAGDTFTETSQKAKGMADTLRQLARQFPQLANEIVKSLGTPGQSMEQLADQVEKGIRRIDFQKVTDAVNKATPAIQKLRDAFEPTLAQRMDIIGGAWDRLLSSFGKSPASDLVRSVLDNLAKGLDEIARKQAQVGKWTVNKPPDTWTGAFLDEFIRRLNSLAFLINITADLINRFVATPVSTAWRWIIDTFRDVIVQIIAAAQTLVPMITTLVSTAIGGAWQWLVDTFNAVIAQLPQLAQTALAAITTLVTTPVGNAWQWIVDMFNSVLEQIKAKASAISGFLRDLFTSSADTSGESVGQFARGGHVGGRGTGTSDSNLAWVSRGEHIMPARAVRQPGVLALLEALRRSGGNLRSVLDDLGHFALGGLVPRTIPAFAAGGLVAGPVGRQPINLTINAGGGERQTFHLWADEQVADSVLRYATKRQVASAGRKSGAFG